MAQYFSVAAEQLCLDSADIPTSVCVCVCVWHMYMTAVNLRQAVVCVCVYDQKGNTALHIASLAGQLDVVKLLLQHDALINSQSQVSGSLGH